MTNIERWRRRRSIQPSALSRQHSAKPVSRLLSAEADGSDPLFAGIADGL
jgi:hypothetical protein